MIPSVTYISVFLTPKLAGVPPYLPEPSTHQAPAGADGHVRAAGLALQVACVEAVGPGGPLPGQAFSQLNSQRALMMTARGGGGA